VKEVVQQLQYGLKVIKEMVQQLQYGLKVIKEIINNQLRNVTSNSPSDIKI
jgi:hypothetical protein